MSAPGLSWNGWWTLAVISGGVTILAGVLEILGGAR